MTKIGNSPFDLSVTRVGNPKISQHLQFKKSENVYILQLNKIEYYTTLFDFENSISANCIEGTLQFACRTEGMKKKRKGFQKQFIFNLEIYLHLPDVGTTLVQYFFFFFFGIEESSFSIQTNFLSHSQLGMI